MHRLRNGKLEISASDCYGLTGFRFAASRFAFIRAEEHSILNDPEGAQVTDLLKEQFFGTYRAPTIDSASGGCFKQDKKA